MADKKRMDLNKLSTKFIIAGLAEMIDNEGLTPHEAFEVLEDIKQNTFHALAEMRRENISKSPLNEKILQ